VTDGVQLHAFFYEPCRFSSKSYMPKLLSHHMLTGTHVQPGAAAVTGLKPVTNVKPVTRLQILLRKTRVALRAVAALAKATVHLRAAPHARVSPNAVRVSACPLPTGALLALALARGHTCPCMCFDLVLHNLSSRLKCPLSTGSCALRCGASACMSALVRNRVWPYLLPTWSSVYSPSGSTATRLQYKVAVASSLHRTNLFCFPATFSV
jgi:hypothetical protein